MDSEMVGFVVPVICSPGEASKPWARKESLRLLGALTSTTCIEAELVFSNHALLTRVCTCVPRLKRCCAVLRMLVQRGPAQLEAPHKRLSVISML